MSKFYRLEHGGNLSRATDTLVHFILSTECKNLAADITELNFIDAAKVCVRASTVHFSKYASGIIKWIVKDEIVKSYIKPLSLMNMQIETPQVNRKEIAS